MLPNVLNLTAVSQIVQDLKKIKKKVVFTVGTFDLLHSGHGYYLAKAKTYGDILIVGVASNESRIKLKGNFNLLLDEKIRAEMVGYLRPVDYVVIVDDTNLETCLKEIKPNIFYISATNWSASDQQSKDKPRTLKEARIVKKYGGKVVKTEPIKPYVSSLDLVDKVALLKIKSVLERAYDGKASLNVDLHTEVPAASGPYLKDMISFNKHFPEELLSLSFLGQVVPQKSLEGLGEKLRKQGKKIVFTAGSWDLLHVGHARYFAKAKECGDVLVAGVSSNSWIRRFKGKGRPIIDEQARAEVLKFLRPVDYVVIFRERTVRETIRHLKPDVFYTVEEEWNEGYKESPEYKVIDSYGGKIVRVPRQAPFISASSIIDLAASNKVSQIFSASLKNVIDAKIIKSEEWSSYKEYTPDLQMTARKLGIYHKVLESLDKCPFCDLKNKYFVKELKNVVLTVALFPYVDGHMLVIPKRHVEKVSELTSEEWGEINNLCELGIRLLKKNLEIENSTLLYREGPSAGKSVGHLHIHVLPFSEKAIGRDWGNVTQPPIDSAAAIRVVPNET